MERGETGMSVDMDMSAFVRRLESLQSGACTQLHRYKGKYRCYCGKTLSMHKYMWNGFVWTGDYIHRLTVHDEVVDPALYEAVMCEGE